MGVVYRARDPRLNRDVAVKLIPPSQLSPESEQRFQREAQLVAQMDHPSIVPIYDFGRHDDALFFVMPLVQGTNLRAFLRQDSQLGDIIDIGIQVAEALDYSHARGVVHRDIKPENIMVAREDGRGVRVRVMDFGLARAQSESRMTRTGTLMGTLGYLSPEQITGHGLDGRSDIYALGTVLYECVVGEPPFSGEAQAVVYRIVHEFPQAPRARGAAIDETLDGIVMDCLREGSGEEAAAGRRRRRGPEALSRRAARFRSEPAGHRADAYAAVAEGDGDAVHRARARIVGAAAAAERRHRRRVAVRARGRRAWRRQDAAARRAGEPGQGAADSRAARPIGGAGSRPALSGLSRDDPRALPAEGHRQHAAARPVGSGARPRVDVPRPERGARDSRRRRQRRLDGEARHRGAGKPHADLRAPRTHADAAGRRPAAGAFHGRSPRCRHLARSAGIHRPAPGIGPDSAGRHVPDHGDHRAASSRADHRGLPGASAAPRR